MPKTGATRYQKFLKSEKAKTKLKAKKDLPKGTNVTKTNFQVKKIVIKEQLKKRDQSEELTTRKLNTAELLNRLNHHNTQTQVDALEGLHELLNNHPDILEKHISQLIQGVASMILNIEKKVRHAALKLLRDILSIASIEKLGPFYNIISTYLRSSMTHINSRIQDDSLLLLDFLLTYTAELVIQDFHKIIPNFLDMISKLRIDSKPGRTLSVNMDSQISTVKWRAKVLQRLQRLFQEYVKYHVRKENKNTQKPIINFNDDDAKYFSLFNANYTTVCPVSCFSSRPLLDIVQVNEVKNVKNYTEILIPMLFETWVEVCPSTSTEKQTETVVNEDAALLLKHILDLISLIWTLVHHFQEKSSSIDIKNTFCQKYRKQFTQHFIISFPFVTNTRLKQQNKSAEETITDPKLVVENLEICHLFIILNPQLNINSQKKEITHVLNYIVKTLNENTQDNVNDTIVNILNTIFTKYLTSWTKNISILDPLMKRVIWTYFNKDMSSSFKQKIFAVLCKIALNDKLKHFHDSNTYEKWLYSLPEILLEESVTPQTVDMIHKFAVRNNAAFNIIIKSKLLKIIENLPVIVITAPCSEGDYHKLFSILYYIKNYDFASLNLLEIQLLDDVYEYHKGKYLIDVLRLRSANVNQKEYLNM